ncbi:hypothetical protein D9M73_180610 [compost metagenome]
MANFDGPALEGVIAKQQLAQGAAAQFVHVQAVTLQRAACRDAAGKHQGLPVTPQIHLAHPAFTAFGQVERGAFIRAQGLPAFEQRRDAKCIIRQMNKASGQRAMIEQPIEDRRVGQRRQLAFKEPDRGRAGGFCVLHNESLLAAKEVASLPCAPRILIDPAAHCAEQACICWARSVKKRFELDGNAVTIDRPRRQ